MLLSALIASLMLHLSFAVPILAPFNLFAAKAPPPEPIPVEIVTLPAKEPEPPAPTPPPPPVPEPPPKPVQLPPPVPPPPVTPQQIVVATREQATPPQGDDKATAAPEKPEPEQKSQPMPPPKPQARPEPPKPEPKPEPEHEVTGAIALRKPPVKPRDQITNAEHRLPPVVVRPTPPGRRGNSLMPSYPSAALANGLQGRVVLLVTLAVNGRPRHIDIARSSGSDQLDESAVRAVWLWRFYRTDGGPPMEATIEIPLDFRL